MSQVHQILQELNANSSKNAKIDILKKNVRNSDLKFTLLYALDPTRKYYIKKIPEYKPNPNKHGTRGLSVLDYGFECLERIAAREFTGDAARDYLTETLESMSAEDASVLAKIVDRDLRCGVQASTVNKAFKDLIPEFPYMRCSLPLKVKLNEYSWVQGVFSQLKADGMYANLDITDTGDVSISSRAGREFPLDEFQVLVNDAVNSLTWNTQTHGELLVRKAGKILPREIGNGILNSVASGGQFDADEEPVYLVWDQIPLNKAVKKGKYDTEYHVRYANLLAQTEKATNIEMIETRIVHSFKEALEHYFEKLDEGLEGTIIKCRTGGWKDGTSKHQCKMKLDVDVDLEVVGFNPGKGKNESTFGSIICRTSDDLLYVNVSGFKDKPAKGILTRQQIWDKRDELVGTIITVKSNNLLDPSASNDKYSLFLPRYVEFRNDKSEADDLQKVKDQFENAIKEAMRA